MMIMISQITHKKKNDTSVALNKGPRTIANNHKANKFSPGADQHIVVIRHRAASPGSCHNRKETAGSGVFMGDLELHIILSNIM